MKTILGFFLLALSMCVSANKDLTMDMNNNESTFVVTLPANPTTGYQWSVVDYDKKLFTLSDSVYKKPQTTLIGGGGQMLFTFSLNKDQIYPQTTKMTFKYARSWDASSASMQKVTINFKD